MHKFRIGWVQILAQVIRIGCVKLQVCIQVSIQLDESHTLLHERQDSIHLMPHEKEFIKALPTTCTCPFFAQKEKRKNGSTAVDQGVRTSSSCSKWNMGSSTNGNGMIRR